MSCLHDPFLVGTVPGRVTIHVDAIHQLMKRSALVQVSLGALGLLVVVNVRMIMLALRQLKLVGLGVIGEEGPQHARPAPGVGGAPTLFGLLRRKRIGAVVVVF